MLTDNICYLCRTAAVNDIVHHDGRDVQCNNAIHGIEHTVKYRCIYTDHQNINDQAQLSDRQMRKREFQQPRPQFRTASGRVHQHQQAHGYTQHHAAVDTGQNRLHRAKCIHSRQTVQHQGTEHHRDQRRQQRPLPQVDPAKKKQRHIERNGQHTHGQHRNERIDNLCNTRHAADGKLIRRYAPIKSQRKNSTTEKNDRCFVKKAAYRMLPIH